TRPCMETRNVPHNRVSEYQSNTTMSYETTRPCLIKNRPFVFRQTLIKRGAYAFSQSNQRLSLSKRCPCCAFAHSYSRFTTSPLFLIIFCFSLSVFSFSCLSIIFFRACPLNTLVSFTNMIVFFTNSHDRVHTPTCLCSPFFIFHSSLFHI